MKLFELSSNTLSSATYFVIIAGGFGYSIEWGQFLSNCCIVNILHNISKKI